jgi:hypothetical protein
MNKFINTMSVLILVFVVIVLMLSSCTGSRGMTNCDAIKYKMSGYNFR